MKLALFCQTAYCPWKNTRISLFSQRLLYFVFNCIVDCWILSVFVNVASKCSYRLNKEVLRKFKYSFLNHKYLPIWSHLRITDKQFVVVVFSKEKLSPNYHVAATKWWGSACFLHWWIIFTGWWVTHPLIFVLMHLQYFSQLMISQIML